ncbi:MAG: ribosome silencing factor [Ignavibacteriales bacterium]|nr:ribosome silencing factor [Ignavibacteriales bacterium]
MTARTLAKRIADLMISKKAIDIVILDLKKLTSATDFFVICSADSDTQVKAIADSVQDGMETLGERVWHQEGYHALRWIVLDYVDVVVHVFHKEERSFYNLDRLWGDAKRTEVQDPLEAPKPVAHKRRATLRKPIKKQHMETE